MDRTSLNQWVAGMLDQGAAAGTARVRQLAVRRFTAWLIVEGLLPVDPFQGMKAPKVDQPVVDPLTDDELRALIRACAAPHGTGPHEPLHHRRDEAIVRLVLETGVRVGEVVALETRDLDLTNGLVTVRRGKGGTGRVVPIGPAATLALSQYLSLRNRHRFAESADLWLGDRGKRFGYDGLSRALRRRAQRAGIQGFHPHKLRHRAAPPLARQRRLRIRADGHGGLDSHRHARALHKSPGIPEGRRRSPDTEPRGSVGPQVLAA